MRHSSVVSRLPLQIIFNKQIFQFKEATPITTAVLAFHTNVLGNLLKNKINKRAFKQSEAGVCTWVIQQHHQIEGCVSIFSPKIDISPLTQQVLDNVFITEKRRKRKIRIRVLNKKNEQECVHIQGIFHSDVTLVQR